MFNQKEKGYNRYVSFQPAPAAAETSDAEKVALHTLWRKFEGNIRIALVNELGRQPNTQEMHFAFKQFVSGMKANGKFQYGLRAIENYLKALENNEMKDDEKDEAKAEPSDNDNAEGSEAEEDEGDDEEETPETLAAKVGSIL